MSIGQQVQDGWRTLAAKHGVSIHAGGIAPISHFSFEYENRLVVKALFVQLMLERGYLASTLFYSMYAHTQEHVDGYLVAADHAFAKIAQAVKAGHVEEQLKGRPAMAGFKRLT